jgi:ribulose-5-phosphate 4-epimerase/fuculose-1-phosphate aldolase
MSTAFVQVQASDEAEWRVRVELAACYRLIARYGMADLIYNHITARVPGPEHHLLINPFGLLYEEITASSLIKINLDGNVIETPKDITYGVNRAGYVIHSAVHGARDDVTCVIHTHTRAGCAIAAMEEGLLPLSQTAMRFHGRVGYHDFEGPATDVAERGRLVAALGDWDALILRHHGLLTCGRTIGEAFHLMQRLDAACQIQVSAMAGTVTRPSIVSQERTAEMFAPRARAPGIPASGTIEWEALLRQQDRIDPSYRT